jgi:uncharacterized lipoprotein
MTRTITMLTLVAAAALAGCNSESHTIGGGNEGDNSASAPPTAGVELPPSIAASKIYRCDDNKVVYVEWMSDNKSANIRTEQSGPATEVKAAEAGQPMTGPAGYSLEGSAAAGSAKIGVPGHSAQSCKA